jgi:MFS family permease
VCGFLFVRTPAAFLLVAIFYGVGQTGLSVARMALLAALVEPPHRTRIRAHMQAAHNAGLALGAGLGGFALYFDTRAAYLTILCLDVATFLVAASILRLVPRVGPSPAAAVGQPRLAVLRDRPYAAVTALNTVLLLYMPLLSLVLPLWIVQRTEAPRWTVSAVLILNTLSVMLFQVRVARRVTGLTSATRLLRYAGAIMLVSCGVFALTAADSGVWGAAAILMLAAALQVIAEMMQASATWLISFDLAPPEKQGQYQGLFGTSSAVARMAGPLLLTSLIIGLGTPGWLILGLLFLGAALAMGPVVRWAETTRPVAAA